MTEYIAPEFTTDPEELLSESVETMQEAFPGWERVTAEADTAILETDAQHGALTGDVAAQVTTSIFRWWGANLLGVTPVDAVSATGEATFTFANDDGHTLDAGFTVAKDVDGTLIGFQTVDEVVCAPGDTVVAGVALVAEDAGETANDLTGDLTIVDSYAYLDTVALDAATSGGSDAEEDEDYLDRLTAELQLLSPRPILPEDFAVLARRVSGVQRAVAIDGFDAEDNEVHQIVVDATGGQWTFEPMDAGQTATGLAHNITASAFQTALEALSNIEPGDVSVSGGPGAAGGGTPYLVEFTGRYANTNVTTSVTTDTLTGGAGTATVSVAETVGTVYDPDDTSTWAERMVTVVALDEDGDGVSAGVKAEIDALLEAEREVNFVVHVIDPTRTTVAVVFTATAWTGWDIAEVEAAAEAAVADYLDPANWGLPESGDTSEWVNDTTVRYLEVAQVIQQTPGVRFVDSLTLNAGTADVTLLGPAPQPSATVAGTVS